MDTINKILADYYWIFLIVGIAILIFLIRFLVVSRKKTKAEASKQASEANATTNEPIKEMPQQPVIQQATQAFSSLPQQTYSEPTLDSLESSASGVNLGFNQNDDGMSMGADGPMLVIDDPTTKNEGFGLVIEDPTIKNEGVSLVIEDPTLSQQTVVAAEPSIFEAAPAPVVEPAPVVTQENSIFEAAPAAPVASVPVVENVPVVPASPAPVVETQTVASVVPAAPVVPQVVVPVQQPTVQVETSSIPVTPVQPQPVVQQTVAPSAPVAPAAPVEAMETLDL